MSTATLTSLAMLKVNIDHGKDYLDYLSPFVIHILTEKQQDIIIDKNIKDGILKQFGLEIPKRTIQIVLQRFARSGLIRKDCGVYYVTENLPHSEIGKKKSKAERHIRALTDGLIKFSHNSAKPISSTDAAVTAMTAFLSEFDITCLKSYLRGTAIPTLDGDHSNDIVLVSEYVIHLQETSPEHFESLMVMVEGHMLANALLCPDLQNASNNYKDTTFYLDTPLLVRVLGLAGPAKQSGVKQLLDLLRNLRGKVAIFEHSRQELKSVIQGAAQHIERDDGYGEIIFEARRQGTTKSDLLLIAERLDEQISEYRIEIKDTPAYIEKLQIDETLFEEILDDEVSYYKQRALEYDINSVRAIYVLRKNKRAVSLEKCRAILVTSNSSFSKAALKYDQEFKGANEVATVITEFSLANISWLKAPIGAPSIPRSETLAFAYAALQPSNRFMNKILHEIDKLNEEGKFTENEHQLLRSSPLTYAELTYLTLGDEAALNEEIITETLRRISDKIKEDESEKTIAEKKEHQKTKLELEAQTAQKEKIKQRLYWRCDRKSKYWTFFITAIITSLIIVLAFISVIYSFGIQPINNSTDWVFKIGILVFTLIGISICICGWTVKGMHHRMRKWFLSYFLKKEEKVFQIGLDDLLNDDR